MMMMMMMMMMIIIIIIIIIVPNNIIMWLFVLKAPLGLPRRSHYESSLSWNRQILYSRKCVVIDLNLVQTRVTGRPKTFTYRT